MRQTLRDNSLTLMLLLLFGLSLVGMVVAGRAAFNEELSSHGLAPVGWLAYATSGDFLSALFENWESEFLQMAIYVILTAMLFQRGSAESRDPDEPEHDVGPPRRGTTLSDWLYEHSLGLALVGLFTASFLLHWQFSVAAANREAVEHGQRVQGSLEYLASPQMWFESFQNWQSEFLSTAVLVVLSIFLRYRGSPESKPVEAKDGETGE